jgi:hypothetical protein
MDNTQTNIPPFGDLHYYRKERQWMGNAAGIDPERPIELALAVDNETQPLDEKADILRRFVAGYPAVADLIYARIYERFDERGMGKPLDKLRDMYHLIALTLQNDNETVWVTMEPAFDVPSIYNHYLRFSIKGGQIVWSNVDPQQKTAVAVDRPLPPRSAVPFLLGILGLIPVVGAFVGGGLVVYSLSYYKSWLLTLIGACGILVTVIVLGLGLNKVRHIPGVWEKIDKQELNTLVRSVEFYKLQHGNYPDNLMQLRKDDQFVPVSDPIHLNPFGTFEYERIGDHYLLFSTGHDGIAHTADDVYPDIKDADSSKIGWIKRK